MRMTLRVWRGLPAKNSKNGRKQWHWTVFAQNGKKIAESGEGVTNRKNMETTLRHLFPGAFGETHAAPHTWHQETWKIFAFLLCIACAAMPALGQEPPPVARPQPTTYAPAANATTVSVKWFSYAAYLEKEIAWLKSQPAPTGSSGSADVIARLDAIDKNTAALAGNFYSIKTNVENTLGLAKDTNALLHSTPPSVVTISTLPVDAVAVGRDVTYSVVEVNGTPAPTLQWFKGGDAIPGATAKTLTLANVALTDAATYKVVATNAAGSAEAQTKLDVFQP